MVGMEAFSAAVEFAVFIDVVGLTGVGFTELARSGPVIRLSFFPLATLRQLRYWMF